MLSKEHGYISGRRVAECISENRPLITMDAADVPNYKALQKVGIGFSNEYLRKAPQAFAMDDVNGGVFTANSGVPVQFLQAWLPGFVRAAFAPRKIDELIGIMTVGEWHDEEVVQGVLETMGDAVPYGDTSNVPFSSYNAGFERRTIVRFEKGISVGRLEEARAGAMRLNSAAEKRAAAELALEMQRNNVGFFGYNAPNVRTYGFLNDPSLPAYITVATGAGSATTWDKKTFLEITADIRQAFTQLQIQSQGVVDAEQTPTCLALPTNCSTFLSVTSEYGNSVKEWISKTYPKCRICVTPHLNGANGGANVFYLYAENIEDGATDDNRVWVQAVPAKFMALGIEQKAKSVVEDYTNATAGVMCKRPYAVYRATGI
ncbi:uncharacterized protein DUF2184 [Volucribacter psittacicida]|uniref:Uncharacterized protein DUF2184 n=1 Tax=Volucribacter psittacicida TaxID=203482 RepID=A0A4R1FXX4_9PAST|nr:major capsid family protein [Volucribacter psittacicida]TCJ96151.1 uncharacterized protein DUF2184 [Volucribacter psittacicida]